MPTEDLLQSVAAKADQLKADATNSVQALQQTALSLDAHAKSLKSHLSTLVTDAKNTVEQDVGFVKVHWPWLVAAAVFGALAATFIRF